MEISKYISQLVNKYNMNMIVKNIVLSFGVLFLMSHLTLFGQEFTKLSYGEQGGSINYQLAPDAENIEGTPYLTKDFFKGVIYFRNNTSAKVDNLNYNICSQKLVFEEKGVLYVIPNTNEVLRFTIGEMEFVNLLSDNQDVSFYQVLEQGTPMTLLHGYDCSVLKGKPSKGYVEGSKDKYVLKDNIYLSTSNSVHAIKLTKNGNDILQYLVKERDKIENYIDTNKLQMKDPDDVALVIRYYNSLLSN